MNTEGQNGDVRKGKIALRVGVVFAFLFALTWALPSVFNWIFLGAAGYSFFLYWHYQPKTYFERKSEFEYESINPAERFQKIFKRVVRIISITVVSLFVIFFVIGIFSGEKDEATTVVPDEGATSDMVVDQATAWNERGYNFYLNKDYDSALFYFERVLRLESANGSAWYNKGMVFYDQQVPDKALESFSRAYDTGIRDAFLSHVLGYLNDNSGNTSRAINFYKEALGMDSSRSDIYGRLAELEPSQAARYQALQKKWKN